MFLTTLKWKISLDLVDYKIIKIFQTLYDNMKLESKYLPCPYFQI